MYSTPYSSSINADVVQGEPHPAAAAWMPACFSQLFFAVFHYVSSWGSRARYSTLIIFIILTVAAADIFTPLQLRKSSLLTTYKVTQYSERVNLKFGWFSHSGFL